MRVKNLNLENFRQHKELSVTFTPGVNVIRGQNEAGKSTILEAIGYALYGTKACRNSDLTSWTRKTAATVTAEFEGEEPFTVCRSKAGAEWKQDEQLVSGQVEVTNKVTEVLGINLEQAKALTLATQDDVRGALARGTTATNNLVEELANLKMIDTLLADIEVPTIKTIEREIVILSDALQQQQQKVKEAEASPILPATEEQFKAEEQPLLQKVQQTTAAFELLKTQADKHESWAATVAAISTKVKTKQTLIKKMQEELAGFSQRAIDFTPDQLAEAQTCLKEYKRDAKKKSLEAQLQHLGITVSNYPSVEGTIHTLEDQISTLKKAMQETVLREANLLGRLSDGDCSFCGLDISQLPRTLAWKEELNGVQEHIGQVKSKLDALTFELTKVTQEKKQFDKLHEELSHYQDIPTEFLYTEAEAQKVVNEAKELAYQQQQYYATKIKIESFTETLQEHLQDLSSRPEPLNPSTETVAEAKQAEDSSRKELTKFRDMSRNLVREYTYWKTCLDNNLQGVETKKQHLKGLQQELEEAVKIKELVTWLRGIKPTIAGKIWTQVLHSASIYASALRQEPTTLVRQGKEFLVNDKALESFSGSALDMLGLAVRCALIKTFCPRTDFLLLDEPFAACDVQRQKQAFAFLSSLGFSQIILVTHDETSEQLAQNLISLGA